MATAIRTLVIVGALLATSAAAQAATFHVLTLEPKRRICSDVVATGAKAAFIACIRSIGIVVPPADAVVTTTRVCKSTHRVLQPSTGSGWYAYDRRFSYVTRPDCPG